jgi:CsoR family transcriptional regulator, copper-sensing transcriptional repressor
MAKTCGTCTPAKAHHSEQTKSDLDKRLARIEGQIRALRKMVTEDTYCDEVLNQVTSVMAALNGIRMLLLEKHIKSCVHEQLVEGKIEVVDELVKTISRMTKQ